MIAKERNIKYFNILLPYTEKYCETNHFFDSFETEEEIRLGLKLSEVIGRKMITKIEKHKIKIRE